MRFCTTTFLATTLMATGLYAQHPTCDGTRYADPVFADIDTVLAVKFGENTTMGGTFQELFMDVYYPADDTVDARPAILLAFGGSFVGGDRSQLSDLCTYYAQRGFVCSCIDYRLYDVLALPDSIDMATEVVMSVSDFKAAIRHLRKDAATTDQFAIDPDWMFIGGVSAGAIAADHTAYLDSTDTGIQQFILDAVDANGGWEGNSNTDTMYSSAVQGVLNFSGGLARSYWINAGDPPLFSAHDDQDNIVPYDGDYARFDLGFITIDVIYMEGSSWMHNQAVASGIKSELITIPNSTGHVSYLDGATWQDSVLSSSARFLQEVLCDANSGINTPQWANPYQVNAFPNPAATDVLLHINNRMNVLYDVTLTDAMGRVVLQANDQNVDDFVLARQQFPAGMYYAQIRPHTNTAPTVVKIIFR